MASALFQGTSLLNMFVHSCRVAAARHCCLACDDALRGAEFVLCATWSDRNEVSLRRSLLDLATLCRGLLQAFPGAVERSALAASALVPVETSCSQTLGILLYSYAKPYFVDVFPPKLLDGLSPLSATFGLSPLSATFGLSPLCGCFVV
uniref:Uncharacterized protein n=1 Tax=Eptatretus burgeri TaxID=7764 RepID=A0A8C4RBA3_EPTBU